jgi:8-oxo-dGTP pyrophosphatase MutT (NUDIX family)
MDKTKHKRNIQKNSLGIACCRVINGRPQILLVHKRYTYAYSEFVHGRYPHNRIYISNLFNNMTNQEKILLLGMDFSHIWYHIWLNSPKNTMYTYAKNRFDSTYVLDGGIKLKNFISRSTSIDTLWEIPKGRKKNKNESDIACAVREFKEETGIEKKTYYIFPNIKKTYSYDDHGIKYINTYYVALTRNSGDMRINLGMQDQLNEISDIRWMNLDELNIAAKHLVPFTQPIFKYIKKRMKDYKR